MARPRKTIAELKAAGTYRPSRHGARARAESDGAAVAAPTVQPTTADVATERARLLALLAGRLTERDGDMLTELAERVVEVRLLRDAARTVVPGTLERTRIGGLLTAATAALDRLATAFGLTPASRAALPEPVQDTPKVLTRPRTKLDTRGAA